MSETQAHLVNISLYVDCVDDEDPGAIVERLLYAAMQAGTIFNVVVEQPDTESEGS